MSLPLSAHQFLNIRSRAPGFDLREEAFGIHRARLGRAWVRVARVGVAGWQQTGPWQIVRDRETLEDLRRLRDILEEIRVKP